jgi:hypothetical protein
MVRSSLSEHLFSQSLQWQLARFIARPLHIRDPGTHRGPRAASERSRATVRSLRASAGQRLPPSGCGSRPRQGCSAQCEASAPVMTGPAKTCEDAPSPTRRGSQPELTFERCSGRQPPRVVWPLGAHDLRGATGDPYDSHIMPCSDSMDSGHSRTEVRARSQWIRLS